MSKTVKEINALKPRETQYKVFLGDGLHTVIYPSGTKVFRLRLRTNNGEKLITLGKTSSLSLKEARVKAQEIRVNFKNDKLDKDNIVIDPSFSEIALLWLESKISFTKVKNRSLVRAMLINHIFPTLSQRRLSTISGKELYDLLFSIQKKGYIETALRAHSYISRIFSFAALQGYKGDDPCPPVKKHLMKAKIKHMPAATDEFQLQAILQRLEQTNNSSKVVILAIKCAFHWFCRPYELRTLRWENVNFKLNRIEFVTAKNEYSHLIPLTPATNNMLEELKILAGDSEFIFQSPTLINKPISENTCNKALRLLGIEHDEMVLHGVRATARTLLSQRFNFNAEHIHFQLGHCIKNKTERAYNRAKHLKERRVMMDAWSNFLLDLTANRIDFSDLIGNI